MNNKKEKPQKTSVRPVAQSVYDCLLMDEWPSPAGKVDFGIESEEHYAALQFAVRDHGVTPEQLDEALGDGDALTALIRPDNPYHGVTFSTSWKDIMVNIKAWADVGPGGKFSLGRLFATPAVLRVVPQDDITQALRRHAAGDWGELNDDDRATNDAAFKDDGEIFSVHRSRNGQTFSISTDEEHSMTLVRLPEE